MMPSFQNPSPKFGPIPFWWWVGEPVVRSRSAWQLDRLNERGVAGGIISYNHHADGSPNRGEPPIFTPAWGKLVRGVLADCKARGMNLGFQDYTLLNPLLQGIGNATPGMAGGELGETHCLVIGPTLCHIAADAGCPVVAARAYPVICGVAKAEESVDLVGRVSEGRLAWAVPEGEWLVSLVFLKPNPFDPMHPTAGAQIIERFYALFEKEFGGELGTTLSISFQDELDFGSRMPLWSDVLKGEFLTRKGYDLGPLLSALWNDLGPVTPKVRIDYSDVVTTLLEERYFIPVFEWHEVHGLLFGNDNCGRGGIEAGRAFYGDAFRTMRWYSAPGNDDPKLAGPRAFKGLKVNSSIAHLYRRPRVWNEGFHSSGWGATPGEVIAALNEDFIYGATVVNLHGLYYSTYGSWWEWAPPDFHFRQPYWDHCSALNQYATRLCQTLSLGVHVCDVAIVYPITAIEAGLNKRVMVGPDHGIPLSELQAGKQNGTFDAAEADAFGIGRHLVNAGIDFDFIDFQSLERAEAGSGGIRVSGETYRVLVLPSMSAVRFSTLETSREFFRSGGTVIAFGCLPLASERLGSNDPELCAMVREIFGPCLDDDGVSVFEGASGGRGIFIRSGFGRVVETIERGMVRDFDPAGSGLMSLHRRSDSKEIYFVFNPGKKVADAKVHFRAKGAAERWDAWTGSATPVPSSPEPEGSRLPLLLESGEGQLIVFNRDRAESVGPLAIETEGTQTLLSLDGLWEFELVPTMDNQFGDFRFPAHPGMVGPEARRFRYAEENIAGSSVWHLPGFDDSSWQLTTASFGPRFWKIGPFPAGDDLEALVAEWTAPGQIDPTQTVICRGSEYRWTPYEFSLRWGIENDPFLKDWASGPHGLKGAIPDDYIDLNCDQPGAVWFLWTTVESIRPEALPFMMGSRSRYEAWLNGELVLRQEEALTPGRQSIWNLPHYHCNPRRVTVKLESGPNPLLIKFVQPEDQRVRAYAAFDLASRHGLALRWFSNPRHPVLNCRPQSQGNPGWYRLTAPPGLSALTVVSRGTLCAWIDGAELPVQKSFVREDGTYQYRFTLVRSARLTSKVVLRVEATAGSFAGDSLPEPVRFECASGEIELGDWSEQGLDTYSGAAWYRRTILLTEEEAARAATLDLGRVAVSAVVRLNGQTVGTLIAPPWRVSLVGHLREGENRLEIQIANTLANHYSVGIPTPYVFAGQTVSGLLGPVHINFQHLS